MSRRNRFYVNAAVWEKTLPSTTFHVYCFLSWCADKSGNCYPSIAAISCRCCISKNTVRKSLRELQQTGLIKAQPQYCATKGGKLRQTSNLYSIGIPRPTTESANTASALCNDLQGVGAYFEGEINDKEEIHKFALSVCQSEDTELIDILDRLSLNCYEDTHFENAVELAIKQMYYADYIKVNGERVPQSRVRERLAMLDFSCIDLVCSRMREYGDNMQSAGKYLISCLYNAPLDFNTDIAAFRAALKQ